MRTDESAIPRLGSRVLVAAHRGTCGGNIIQNTVAAYETALHHGADIIEMDMAASRDGVFYAFHTGQERVALGLPVGLHELDAARIDAQPMLNSLGHATNQRLCRVGEILEAFRGRCWINIDRSWWLWERFLPHLVSFGMEEQLLLKSPPTAEYLGLLEALAPDVPYMPICYSMKDVRFAQGYKVNMVAAELIFPVADSEFASPQTVKALREEGLSLWANAITLDDDSPLTAGFDDDASLLRGPQHGWQRLVEMGFDIIQTDWPATLKAFLNGTEI